MDRPFKLRRVLKRWKRGRTHARDMQTIDENSTFTGLVGLPSIPPTNRIVINVGGTRFETYKTTLRNIPDTRLAWITESKAGSPDYDTVTGEYFFDRHPHMFLMILNYYRTGRLHSPTDVCGPAFEDELAFWGIDEKQIESCCWGGYSQHREAQQTMAELNIDNSHDDNQEDDRDCDSTAEKFGITEDPDTKDTLWQKYRPKIWAFLDDPRSSVWAKVYTAVSLLFVFVVIAAFSLETHHHFRVSRNKSVEFISIEGRTAKEYRDLTEPHPAFVPLDITCAIFFTIELAFRLVFCPNKKEFFTKLLNWVDILSLIPVFLTRFILLANPDMKYHVALVTIQRFRLIRVFRVFKLVKHFEALKILFHAIKASARELFLMVFLIGILVMLFATLIYYAEQVEEVDVNNFTSIPIGFWWAVVTMTTLGYGDVVPKTCFGYFVGSLCAISGVLFIALPIPIIVNNFAIYYSHAKAQAKLPKKRKHILVGAADALKQVPRGDTEDTESQHSHHSFSDNDVSEQMNSSDSGIKSSTESMDQSQSSKMTTNGISVTFTDVEEEGTTSKYNNGFMLLTQLALRSKRAAAKNQIVRQSSSSSVTIIEESSDDIASKSYDPASKSYDPASKSYDPSMRRGSIIPGGVSQPIPKSGCRSGSVSVNNSVRIGGPRERRRSLMPL